MERTKQRAQAVAAYWGKTLEPDSNDWFSVNMASENNAEIRIYDVIGWPWVEADAFLEKLSRIDAERIKIRINSPGGDVFDGTAIYNAIKDHPAYITTKVEGLAASMASIVALAGDQCEISKSAFFMIHNPWSFSIGDKNDMEKAAKLLDKIGLSMAGIYSKKTGKNTSEILAMMDDETWFSGQEAMDTGFMDDVSKSGSSSARFNLSMYSRAPKSEEPNKRDVERSLMHDAGLSRAQARQLLQNGFGSLTKQDAGDDGVLTAVDNLINNLRGYE